MTSISSRATIYGISNPLQSVQTANGNGFASNALTSSKSSQSPATVISLFQSTGSAPRQKDFATVANDARSALDAGYQKLGKPADMHTNIDEWKTVFGQMDRRSLYAVASNEGRQFSQQEKDVAH